MDGHEFGSDKTGIACYFVIGQRGVDQIQAKPDGGVDGRLLVTTGSADVDWIHEGGWTDRRGFESSLLCKSDDNFDSALVEVVIWVFWWWPFIRGEGSSDCVAFYLQELNRLLAWVKSAEWF